MLAGVPSWDPISGGRWEVLQLTATNGHIQQIPLENLKPGPWQPRKLFDDNALKELALSIQSHGVLIPLRVIHEDGGDGYLIVSGERRWRAAALVGIADLPCIVMKTSIKVTALQELAIVDNLHRANLRPGEEARAVAELGHLGLKQRHIAERLGKSQAWVSQRLAMSKLPDTALICLDCGTLTCEEALALSKLVDYPDFLEACLEPSGTQLKAQLDAHVPAGISERVQAVMQALEMERGRSEWEARMLAGGHRLLDQAPKGGDHRYVRLLQGSHLARAHQEGHLSCEAWAWELGRPVRYCTNPQALQEVAAEVSDRDPSECARQQERRRTLELEASRDAVIKAWLATSHGLDATDLGILARARLATLIEVDEGVLARLGTWLGGSGDRASRAELGQSEIDNASERRLIQLWFLVEAAHAMSYSVIPNWLAPWLEKLGFLDPYGTNSMESINAGVYGRLPTWDNHLSSSEG